MATKSRSNGYSIEFVNIRLGATEVRHLQSLGWSDEQAIWAFLELVEAGYKLSLTSDNKNDTYIATLVGHGDNCPNKGKGLSGRGPTPAEAIKSLLYKHTVICDGTKWLVAADDPDLRGYG
jgi:hypothetical protein